MVFGMVASRLQVRADPGTLADRIVAGAEVQGVGRFYAAGRHTVPVPIGLPRSRRHDSVRT